MSRRNEKQEPALASVGGSDDVMMEPPAPEKHTYLDLVDNDLDELEVTPEPKRQPSNTDSMLYLLNKGGFEAVGRRAMRQGQDRFTWGASGSGAVPPAKPSSQESQAVARRDSSQPAQGLVKLETSFLKQFLCQEDSGSAQTTSAKEKREISPAGQAAEARASGAAKKGRIQQAGLVGRAGPEGRAGPVGLAGGGAGRVQEVEFEFDQLHRHLLKQHCHHYDVRVRNWPAADFQMEQVIDVPEHVVTHFMLFLCNAGKPDVTEKDVPSSKIWHHLCFLLDKENKEEVEKLLEKGHFIAYILPTDQPSKHCPEAALLTKQEVTIIVQSAPLKCRCVELVRRILEHFGIQYDPVYISFEVEDSTRLQRLKHGNHNQLRMSRLLRFMKIINMQHSIELLQFLSSLVYEKTINKKGILRVSELTFNEWHHAVWKPSALSL